MEGSNLFESLVIGPKGALLSKSIRVKASELFILAEEISSCREKAIAITKLEEVCMWLNKALARNPVD